MAKIAGIPLDIGTVLTLLRQNDPNQKLSLVNYETYKSFVPEDSSGVTFQVFLQGKEYFIRVTETRTDVNDVKIFTQHNPNEKKRIFKETFPTELPSVVRATFIAVIDTLKRGSIG